MSKTTQYAEDQLPRYASIAVYPNSRKGHQLRRLKNGAGLCSCERWQLEGFNESAVVRSHQYHINNLQEQARGKQVHHATEETEGS
jgi:hypothetical protein